VLTIDAPTQDTTRESAPGISPATPAAVAAKAYAARLDDEYRRASESSFRGPSERGAVTGAVVDLMVAYRDDDASLGAAVRALVGMYLGA
jgi:hypothetical protein